MVLLKRLMWLLSGLVVALLATYIYFYSELSPADDVAPYDIPSKNEDTLRVVMIGDSWSMFHNNLNRDSVLRAMLQKRINVPLKVRSRGKGGANSKEIYYYMFSSRTIESEHEPDRCTQPLLEEHPDYCLISAGINDACQGKGTDF